MAKGVNVVALDGHLGRDPELKFTQGGQPYATLSLATSTESRKNQSGEWEDVSQWHRVVVWGPDGEDLAQGAHKGDRCAVMGTLTYRSWEKDGQRHYLTEIKATTAKYWPKDGTSRTSRTSNNGSAGGGRAGSPPSYGDDDIPF